MIKYITLFFLLTCFSQLNAQWIVKTNIGSAHIIGDIEHIPQALNSGEVGAAYRLKKYLFVDSRIGYAQMYGLSSDLSTYSNTQNRLIGKSYVPLGSNYFFTNYKKDYGYIDLSLSLSPSFNNDKVLFEFGAGIGTSASSTNINLYDKENNVYDLSNLFFSSQKARLEFYDESYETNYEEADSFSFHFNLFIGCTTEIGENTNIGFSIKRHFHNDDNFDAVVRSGTNSKLHSIAFYALNINYLFNIVEF